MVPWRKKGRVEIRENDVAGKTQWQIFVNGRYTGRFAAAGLARANELAEQHYAEEIDAPPARGGSYVSTAPPLMTAASEVAQFLALLDLPTMKKIAGSLEIPRNRNLPELRLDVERACDSSLGNLVRKGVMSLIDWNDVVDCDLFGDRRKSFEDLREEIRDRLHPINRLRPETVSAVREEPGLLREAAEALGVSEDDVRRLLAPFHGNQTIGTVRDELLASRARTSASRPSPTSNAGAAWPLPVTAPAVSHGDATQVRPPGTGGRQRFFQTEGVWPVVEAFLRELPVGTEVIWVTFSFDASAALLALLAERRHHVRVLCRHPRAGLVIYRRAFRAWASAGVGELYGLKTREGEDEEESPGPLHAKALLANTPSGHRGLVGSFNLATTSLTRNTESISRLGQDAVDWWQESVDLLRGPFVEPIREEDCADDDGALLGRTTFGRDVVVVGGPATRARAPGPVQDDGDPSPTEWSPVGLGYLRTALDEMLRSWPPVGPSRGWQQKVFRRLWRGMGETRTDVLFLPVGVGKTFIALRWLVEHFNRAALEQGSRGLFLAPNEWVARSVARDIAQVVAKASSLTTDPGAQRSVVAVAAQILEVRRPGEFDATIIPRLSAVVADECHNWSDAATNGTGTSYRSVVESLRGARARPRLLGLSATPCRMEHGRFDVTEFLRRFRGSASSDSGTAITLREAIDQGLLARFRVKPLLRGNGREKVDALLQSDDAVVAMGDYHLVVLREVWSVLMAHQRQLLNELEDALTSARRVLVFVPPVGADADGFVNKLGRRVRQLTGRQDTFFDFRDRAESEHSAREIFERFRDVDVARGRPAVLVTVNRFSEGVSINDIDTLVFLRATLSPRVAVQALGRGLRIDPRHPEKVCTVYDGVCFAERLERWEAGASDGA